MSHAEGKFDDSDAAAVDAGSMKQSNVLLGCSEIAAARLQPHPFQETTLWIQFGTVDGRSEKQ